MTETLRRATRTLFPLIGLTLLSVTISYTVVFPDAARFRLLLLGAIGLSLGLFLRPHTLIPIGLIVFGVATATTHDFISFSGLTFYPTDIFVLIVLVRGLLPRQRVTIPNLLSGIPFVLFLLWSSILAVASIRGSLDGTHLASIIRREVALFYFPLLFLGFSRMLREVGLDLRLLWRNLTIVVLGFVAWMLLMRVLNHPFETVNNSGLGIVQTSSGQEVHRDFGFASAFVLYPILGLVGIAGMAWHTQRRAGWIFIAFVGVLGTLLSLGRGLIFSMCLGAAIIFFCRSSERSATARFRTVVQVGLGVAAAAFALVIINPTLGNAVVERSLPGIARQSTAAHSTAEYRAKALSAGISVARAHPNGLGVLEEPALEAKGIDPNFLVHSGVTYLLVDGGWPAAVSALLLVLALVFRSFKVRSNPPWMHPAFVGVMTMLAAFSVTAAGLAGDPWVIGPAALAIALRFTLGGIQDPMSDVQRLGGYDRAGADNRA